MLSSQVRNTQLGEYIYTTSRLLIVYVDGSFFNVAGFNLHFVVQQFRTANGGRMPLLLGKEWGVRKVALTSSEVDEIQSLPTSKLQSHSTFWNNHTSVSRFFPHVQTQMQDQDEPLNYLTLPVFNQTTWMEDPEGIAAIFGVSSSIAQSTWRSHRPATTNSQL